MKMKLIAMAVATGLAMPMAAMADVKVGGHAQVEYYQMETDSTTVSNNVKGAGLIDNARGRFWIAVDEDLGGGMKALAHYEFSVDIANSGQSEANGNASTSLDGTLRTFDQRTREKFVGLSGNFGAVKFGNQHGVYKRTAGVRWDPFNATVLEARSNGGQSGSDVSPNYAHNGFIPGAIKYESGKTFGDMVSLEVLYSPEKNETGTAGDGGTGNDWQVGVSIKPMKGLEVIAVASSNAKTPNATTGSDQDGMKLGARFSMGDHTVWVQLEEIDTNSNFTLTSNSAPTSTGVTTATKGEATFNWIGYTFKFAPNTQLAVQYGEGDFTASGTTTRDHEYMSLGVIHNLSKNTSTWVGYRATERTVGSTSVETDVLAAGLRVNF